MIQDHIARIIERLDPVDREALEQHLADAGNAEDYHLNLGMAEVARMNYEKIERINSLEQQNASLLGSIQALQALRNRSGVDLEHALRGEIKPDSWQPADRLGRVSLLSQECEKLRQERDELAAQLQQVKHHVGIVFLSNHHQAINGFEQLYEIAEQSPSACLSEVRAQAIDELKSELVKSVSAPFVAHIEGVLAVVTDRIRRERAK